MKGEHFINEVLSFCSEKCLNNPNRIDNIVGISATGELIIFAFDSEIANQLDRTVKSDVNTSIVLDGREK